jgi:peptidoglycan/LPS O-acetylase OafA/YrhL
MAITNTKHHRREDIQGLRALAVIAVICFHARLPIPGGFTGVDIFFVISGFVITLMLCRQVEREGSVSLVNFYLNRFKRLSPALSVVVTVTIALSAFLLSPLGANVKISVMTGVRAVFMTANVYIARNTGGYFDPAAETNPLLNTWSLSVEEQFYFFFPAALLLSFYLQRRGGIWRHSNLIVVIGLLCLSVAAMFSSWSGIFSSQGKLLSFYNPIPRAWEFAVGALLALLLHKISYKSQGASNFFAVIGAILVLLSFFAVSGKDNYPGIITLLPVLAASALIIAGSCERTNAISTLLSSRQMVYVGDISYSWYLWHWPIIVFTSVVISDHPSTLAIAALASLVPAIASYKWIETPLRRIPVTGMKQSLKFIALTLIPPIIVGAVVLKSSAKGYWIEKIHNFQASYGPLHAGNTAGCGHGKVPESSSDDSCLWNATAAGTPVYLIGDSNADHFSEAVISAGESVNSPVRVFTKGGCAFIGESWSDRSEIEQAACLGYVNSTLEFLKNTRPGIVVFGISDSAWSLSHSAVGPDRTNETSEVNVALPYLRQQLQEKISAIQAFGHKVLLLQPVPKFVQDSKAMFDAGKCSTIAVAKGSCPTRVSVTASDQFPSQANARIAILETAKILNTELLDVREVLCDGNECFNHHGANVLYRDAGHLSVTSNAHFVSHFAKKFLEMQAKSSD